MFVWVFCLFMQSKLKDRSVIQLFSNPERMYLCLGRKVHSTDVEEEGSMSHS